MPLLARTARAALALLLAVGWLLLPPVPADAAGPATLERPTPGERVTFAEPFRLVAFTDAHPGEEVRAMQARLLRAGTPLGDVRPLEFIESVDVGPGIRRTRWGASFDPLENWWANGAALRNGGYRLEVRAIVAVQNVPRAPSDWRGHDFVVDVDPPAPAVTVKVVDEEKRRVEVHWDPSEVPDFTRYLVQRKSGDGEFADYREVDRRAATTWTDIVPEYGEHAYRVRVYRSAAGSGERRSLWSAAGEVTVAEPPPPPPSSETAEPTPPPRAPSVSRPAPQRVRPVAPPNVSNSTFRETIDYGVEFDEAEAPLATGPEWDEFDEPGANDSGTLEVREGGTDTRRMLVPVAAGLLLTVSALHVRRFMSV